MASLDFYWELASTNESTRQTAAKELVETLVKIPFDAPQEALNSFSGSVQELETICSPDLIYALNRLVKGLASGRDCARLGFSLALTELIHNFSWIRCSTIFELLTKYTDTTGSMKGVEVRDILFGRVFGIQTMIQSGCLDRDHTSLSDLQQAVDLLLTCADKKSFLEEGCFWLVIEIVCKRREVAEYAFNKICPENQETALSLSQVYFQLELMAQGVELEFKSPLENKNLMQQVLKDSIVSHPQLHRIWHTLFKLIKAGKLELSNFWSELIEDNLFASTHFCKYAGFLVFQELLTTVSELELASLFTPAFTRCFITSLANSSTFMHKIAKKLAKRIIGVCVERPEICAPLALALPLNFDILTKTSTVSDLVSKLDVSGLTKYMDHLMASPPAEYLTSQIASLLKNKAIPREKPLLERALFFLHDAGASNSKTLDKFFYALDDLNKIDGPEWMQSALDHAVKNANADEQVLDLCNKAMRLSSASCKTLACLLALFCLTGRDADAINSLTELIDLDKRLNRVVSGKKRKMEEQMCVHDVLVDFLISCLSKPSRLVRDTCLNVFQEFCGGVSEKGIDVIFEIIDSRDEGDGVLQVEDDGMDDEEGIEDEDSDVESATEVEEMDIDQQDSDSDSGLDDTEMEAFDSKLAEIFREKKRLADEKKASKQQLSHFKIRIVDLVEVYVKKQPENPLVVYIAPKILSVILKTQNSTANGRQEIHSKLINILDRLVKSKSTPQSVDSNILLDSIRDVHAKCASSALDSNMAAKCSLLSLYLCKIAGPEKCIEIYLSSAKTLLSSKKTRLTVKFITDFTRFSECVELINPVLDMLDFEVLKTPYQFIEGLKIFNSIVSSMPRAKRLELSHLLSASMEKLTSQVVKGMQTGIPKKRLKGVLEQYRESLGNLGKIVDFAVCKEIKPELESLDKSFEKVCKQILRFLN